jgi:MFS family permease
VTRKNTHSKAVDPTAAAVVEKNASRNFFILGLHQILYRTGWIFKTESIVIPAFLDYVGGTAWLRGCLPMLNRLGHSIPPILFSRRLKVMPQKKWVLVYGSVAMAVPFLALSAVWFVINGERVSWLPWVFLALYALFFMVVGVNQMAFHTLTGKLVKATRRGRLLTFSTAIGAPAAILAASLLLGPWLERSDHGFGYIFGFTGVAFLLTAIFGMTLREPADNYEEKAAGLLDPFAAALRIIRDDHDFRRLAAVAALFSTVLVLFPHYQAMGRTQLDLRLDNLLLWVVVQNAATGLFSLLAGPIADRSGNRLVLRWVVFFSAAPPLLATFLGQIDPELGRRLYWLVFFPIGLTPLTIKVLMNYALEISAPADHPRYVSTLSLCVAAPTVVFSPLVGLIVDLTSFEFVFITGAIVILLGGSLTYRLREPRHHNKEADVDGAAIAVEE